MRSNKRPNRFSPLAMRLFTRYLLSLAALFAAVVGGDFCAAFICYRFPWSENNPLYYLLKVVERLSPVLIVLLLLAGFVWFTVRALRQPLGYLDDVITVEDEDLVVAFLDMVENHKMIVENSGLLTVAALKQLNVKDKRIVSILSGGNMDVITMSSVVQHGLIQRGRIFSVSCLLPDKPGELAKVASLIAQVKGNIIKLDHNQFITINRSAAVELKITMESFGESHKKEIIAALAEGGFRPKEIRANL